MHRQTGRRRSIAWTLYASLLFAALHCGLGHGQAISLTLNGMGGAFCGHAGAAPNVTRFDHWPGDTLASGSMIDCPLCSHTGLAFTPLLPDLPVVHLASSLSLIVLIAWPRRLWPTANPRASPAAA
ncbi:DUF2946 family protein [Pseudomonas sp. WHRI 8519]|uniref:DUF2946 family protein n=1 Tax=Pseudomonas sp. WHRI 8519 TaxID=3162567 RepID=UPI003555C7B1